MSMAWVDYRKDFHSVPCIWIIKSLELFKVSSIIVNLDICQICVTGKQHNFLSRKSGNRKSNRLDIQCDIFQGDSLSTLLFCLVLIP